MSVFSSDLQGAFRAPQQMSAMLNGSQSQAFPLRATLHLGAENCGEGSPIWCYYFTGARSISGSKSQYACIWAPFLLSKSKSKSIPSPPRLLSWPFQGCFQATHPCAFPHPPFYQKMMPTLLNYPVLPLANSPILPKDLGTSAGEPDTLFPHL